MTCMGTSQNGVQIGLPQSYQEEQSWPAVGRTSSLRGRAIISLPSGDEGVQRGGEANKKASGVRLLSFIRPETGFYTTGEIIRQHQ